MLHFFHGVMGSSKTAQLLMQRYNYQQLGLRVAPLSNYYRFPEENSHCLVINYSGLTEDTLSKLEEILCKL